MNASRVNPMTCVLLLATMAATLCQATPNVPQPAQTRPLLITGATLHTVSGAVIENGKMLVMGGRITALSGVDGNVDARGAEVLNLSGKHVYPGFVAANTVLGLGGGFFGCGLGGHVLGLGLRLGLHGFEDGFGHQDALAFLVLPVPCKPFRLDEFTPGHSFLLLEKCCIAVATLLR